MSPRGASFRRRHVEPRTSRPADRSRRADSAFSVRSRLVSLAARSFQFIGKDDGEATPSLSSFSGRSSGGRRFESALPYNM